MKYKKITIISGLIVLLVIGAMIVMTHKNVVKTNVNLLYATAQKGNFDVIVMTTGELQAKNYSEIAAPIDLRSRNLRINSVAITDLVPEGTLVDSGDYVATLNRTDLDNTLKTETETLTTAQNNLEMKMLDTAVTLSSLRNDIKNLTFSVEDAKIILKQSKYEPPTTIRQAEISVDEATRTLEQSLQNYNLKTKQALRDIKTIRITLVKQQQKVNELENVLSQFIITSPASGMVIYKKERDGTKRKIGSSIGSFDLVIATLPDMSSMVSKTYVNEIDVNKINVGMKATIVMDAFPKKIYTGEVVDISNIGEQLPNTDAKVFEVLINIDKSDETLRPSMTSANKIIIKTIKNAIYIPLACIQTKGNIKFVYTKDKKEQSVILGEYNENNVIITEGLDSGTIVYINNPFLSLNK